MEYILNNNISIDEIDLLLGIKYLQIMKECIEHLDLSKYDCKWKYIK